MASARYILVAALAIALVLEGSPPQAEAQLSPLFYALTCPSVFVIIGDVVTEAFKNDSRMGASLLRLHYHDCFVNGCDGSILLDNTTSIDSEKFAIPNNNSIRGFEVVDKMKADLEKACPGVVSCADILAIAAQISVTMSGGPVWAPLLGRKDSLTASRTLANQKLPSPFDTLDQLKANFINAGLNNLSDLVTLSGAHTFGRARCLVFSGRLVNFNNTGSPDPTLNTTLLPPLTQLCPQGGNSSVITNLDVTTPNGFDNKYFTNLQNHEGLMQSDQELFSTPGADTAALVNQFGRDEGAFFSNFVISIIKMGNLAPPTGTPGQIRSNCRRVNGNSNDILATTSSPSQGDLISSI